MGARTRDNERRGSLAKRDPEEDFKEDVGKFRDDAAKALPSYFKKLTGIYSYRVYWFEIFECAADLARR